MILCNSPVKTRKKFSFCPTFNGLSFPLSCFLLFFFLIQINVLVSAAQNAETVLKTRAAENSQHRQRRGDQLAPSKLVDLIEEAKAKDEASSVRRKREALTPVCSKCRRCVHRVNIKVNPDAKFEDISTSPPSDDSTSSPSDDSTSAPDAPDSTAPPDPAQSDDSTTADPV